MSDSVTEDQVRRAREVLNGAGWLFDEVVNSEMAKVLASDVSDREGREAAYMLATTAARLKLRLQGVVETYEYQLKLAEQKEARNGR